jgi:hypothetical protein
LWLIGISFLLKRLKYNRMKLIKWMGFGFVLLLMPVMQQGCSSGDQRLQGSEDELRGTISISGAFALYPLTVRWAEEFRKEHPRVRIDISAGGAGKGMADVLSGMVDLAMFSREITQAELDRGAWLVAVSKDAVVVTVNSNNPFLDQLKRHGISRETFQEIYLNQSIKGGTRYPGCQGLIILLMCTPGLMPAALPKYGENTWVKTRKACAVSACLAIPELPMPSKMTASAWATTM